MKPKHDQVSDLYKNFWNNFKKREAALDKESVRYNKEIASYLKNHNTIVSGILKEFPIESIEKEIKKLEKEMRAAVINCIEGLLDGKIPIPKRFMSISMGGWSDAEYSYSARFAKNRKGNLGIYEEHSTIGGNDNSCNWILNKKDILEKFGKVAEPYTNGAYKTLSKMELIKE